MRRTTGWLGAAIVLVACSTQPGGEVQESVVPSGDLASTMEVEANSDAVILRLHVTNVGTTPVDLEFTSGQRYDFAVETEGGESVWTWSADKSFMQALGTETLGPGESLRYSERWQTGGRSGRFVGIGTVTSTNEPVRQSVYFDLAGGE